jgi:predicted nucleotidyltransferase
MTKEDILNFLKSKKEYLKSEFDIDKIGLFGSFARDEANRDSDIDFVIVTSKKSFKNRYKLKEYLTNSLEREIDIGYYDSLREFIKNSIKDEIIYV